MYTFIRFEYNSEGWLSI